MNIHNFSHGIVMRYCRAHMEFITTNRLNLFFSKSDSFDIDLILLGEGLDILSRSLDIYKTDSLYGRVYCRYVIDCLRADIDKAFDPNTSMEDMNLIAHRLIRGMLSLVDTLISVELGGYDVKEAQG